MKRGCLHCLLACLLLCSLDCIKRGQGIPKSTHNTSVFSAYFAMSYIFLACPTFWGAVFSFMISGHLAPSKLWDNKACYLVSWCYLPHISTHCTKGTFNRKVYKLFCRIFQDRAATCYSMLGPSAY